MVSKSQAAAPAGVDEIVSAVKRIQQKGKKLPSERQLAGMLDVKRHQLRKALDVLRKAGEIGPPARRRDASATQPRYSEDLVRMTNPLEVLELRTMIEPGLARLASLRASAFEVAKIKAAATTPKDRPAGEVDLAFHLAVAAAARNHLAGEFYKMLRRIGVDARVRIARTNAPSCPKETAKRDSEHMAIADAIERRDPEAAEAAMKAHLVAVQKRIHERSTASAFAA